MKRIVLIMLVLVIVSGIVFPITAYAEYFSQVVPTDILSYPQSMQVKGNNVRIRKGPGTNYTILGEMNYGEYIYIESFQYENIGWDWGYPYITSAIAQFYLPDHVDGYINTAYV